MLGYSSSKTPLKVRLLAPGNWCGEWKESREEIKATRQMTQSRPAPRNWSGEMSQLLRKSLRIEEIAQDVILKDEQRMGKIQEIVGKPRNGSRTQTILEKSEKTRKLCDI